LIPKPFVIQELKEQSKLMQPKQISVIHDSLYDNQLCIKQIRVNSTLIVVSPAPRKTWCFVAKRLSGTQWKIEKSTFYSKARQ